jgi:ketosteroid isomerase-like protein
LDDNPKYFTDVTSKLHRRADGLASSPEAANLRSLRAQIDAIASGDIAAVMQYAEPDITLEIFAPPEFPFVRTAHGLASFTSALTTNFGAVTDQRPVITDVFAEGDRVVLFGRESGAVRATGLRYDVEFVQRFTFRDDRLVSVQIVVAHSMPRGD